MNQSGRGGSVHGHLPYWRYAWLRLVAALVIATLGGIGLWSAVVVLPTIEQEFSVGRGGASVPYTATMIGFAIGGVVIGRLADRRGIMIPLLAGTGKLGGRFCVGAFVPGCFGFILGHGLLLGLSGGFGTFCPPAVPYL